MMEQFMLLHSYALYDLLRERIFNSVSHFFIFAILLKLQLHSFCFKRLLDYGVLCKLIQNLLHDAFFSGLIPFVDCAWPACIDHYHVDAGDYPGGCGPSWRLC